MFIVESNLGTMLTRYVPETGELVPVMGVLLRDENPIPSLRECAAILNNCPVIEAFVDTVNFGRGISVERDWPDVQEAKDALKEAGYLMVFWCEDDVRGYELGEGGYDDEGNVIPPLTDEEVGDIMYSLESNFDASLGINWDTIGSEVWEALENRKND